MRASRLILLCLCFPTVALAQAGLFQILDNPIPARHGLEDTGDLDGDGDLDLLAPDGIYVNDGHARFALAPAPTIAFSRGRAKLADLNGDGLADLITNHYVQGTPLHLRIDLNVGAFAFTPGPLLVTGTNIAPGDFACGDVDLDGDLDILVGTSVINPANYSSTAAAPPMLWLNNGAGSFNLAPPGAAPSVAVPFDHVMLADLDTDGDLDAAFASEGIAPPLGFWTATNAGGTFTLSATPVWAGQMGRLSLASFNTDQLPDAVFLSGSGAVVLINSPTGFLAPVSTTNSPGWTVVALDLNADGIDEILLSLLPGVSTRSVAASGLIGPPVQSFGDLHLSNAPGEFFNPIVGDLDGDTDRDVIAFTRTQSVALMNDAAGGLVRVSGRIAGFTYQASHSAADLDGDGDVDVFGSQDGSPTIMPGLNDGDGFFSNGTPFTLPAAPWPGYYLWHSFDRDGDGDPDLYATLEMGTQPGVTGSDLFFDNVGGAFTQTFSIPGTADARFFRTADLDGDGDLDVVMAPWKVSQTPPGPLSLVLNLGSAGFAPRVPIGTSHFTFGLELADFDGNGTIDVLQINRQPWPNPTYPPDPSILYLNAGSATFTPVVLTGISGWFATAGDVNGDGLVDAIIDGMVRLNAGGGTFVAGPGLVSALGGRAILVDVDGDGDLDLVETPATVMFNSGSGLFGPPVSYLPRFGASFSDQEIIASTLVDADQDGDKDIISPGPIVLVNTTRQIAHGSIPRPGRPASINLYGTPGGAWMAWASNGTASFAYPPWGQVLIDPASAQLGAIGTFAPATSAAPGTATLAALVPSNPALIGWTTWWQSIDFAASRLTNRIKITVMGY